MSDLDQQTSERVPDSDLTQVNKSPEWTGWLTLSEDDIKKRMSHGSRRDRKKSHRPKETITRVTTNEITNTTGLELDSNLPINESSKDIKKSSPELEPVADIEIISVTLPSDKKKTSHHNDTPHYNHHRNGSNRISDDDDDDDDDEFQEEEEEEGDVLNLSSDDSEDIWIDNSGDNANNPRQALEYEKFMRERSKLLKEQEELLRDQVSLLKNYSYYKVELVRMKTNTKVERAKGKLYDFIQKSKQLRLGYYHDSEMNVRYKRRSK